jgi:hypothetical protein
MSDDAVGPPPSTESRHALEPKGDVTPPAEGHSGRPFVERLGLGFIALVVATLFGTMSTAAWAGGERFLAVMAAVGALMTLWAAVATVVRG